MGGSTCQRQRSHHPRQRSSDASSGAGSGASSDACTRVNNRDIALSQGILTPVHVVHPVRNLTPRTPAQPGTGRGKNVPAASLVLPSVRLALGTLLWPTCASDELLLVGGYAPETPR